MFSLREDGQEVDIRIFGIKKRYILSLVWSRKRGLVGLRGLLSCTDYQEAAWLVCARQVRRGHDALGQGCEDRVRRGVGNPCPLALIVCQRP
jgi:hypothetical protein